MGLSAGLRHRSLFTADGYVPLSFRSNNKSRFAPWLEKATSLLKHIFVAAKNDFPCLKRKDNRTK